VFLSTARLNENALCYYSDIATQNMVIEESRLIPKGSHWCNPDSHSGFPGDFFSWKNRCSLRPAVQYYYIDFGLSKHFPGGKESARITATLRTFPMIPELSLTVPYNPFYVDVFQLGLAMSRIIDVCACPYFSPNWLNFFTLRFTQPWRIFGLLPQA
jgi:serine/threonine protein kinase